MGWAAAAVFAVTLALPPAAAAAPLYTFLDLGTLRTGSPGDATYAYDVNELGHGGGRCREKMNVPFTVSRITHERSVVEKR